MARVRVPVIGTVNKSIRVQPDATVGARLGRNLFLEDGSVATRATLAQALRVGQAAPQSNLGDLAVTLWSLIRSKPANIVSAEAVAGVGLITRQSDGSWVPRSLVGGAGISITTPDGDGGNPSIAAALALGQLTDVTITTPATGEVPRFNGTAWANAALAFSDLSGVIANAQVPQSAVTQHQAALTILETQISDGALLARLAAAETVTGAWTFDADITFADGRDLTFTAGILGDKIAYQGAIGSATADAVGVETNTLYHKAAVQHRWYIGTNADNGASERMLLVDTALTVKTNRLNLAANAADPTLAFFAPGGTAQNGFIQFAETVPGVFFRSEMHGATLIFQGEDSAGVVRPLFDADPDGLFRGFHAGSVEFQTQNSDATGATSGLRVRKHDQELVDVGYNVVRRETNNVSFSPQASEAGGIAYYNNATNYTITLDSNVDFPVDSRFEAASIGAGTISVNAGSGVTIRFFNGPSVTSGNFTFSGGAWLTFWKFDASTWHVSGVK